MMKYSIGNLSMIGATAIALLAGQDTAEQQAVKPGQYLGGTGGCLVLPAGALVIRKLPEKRSNGNDAMLYRCLSIVGTKWYDMFGIEDELIAVASAATDNDGQLTGEVYELAITPDENCKGNTLSGDFKPGGMNFILRYPLFGGRKLNCTGRSDPKAKHFANLFREARKSIVRADNFNPDYKLNLPRNSLPRTPTPRRPSRK